MVGVLVGNQNGGDFFGALTERPQPLEGFAARQTGIHQNTGCTRRYQRTVPTTAASEHRHRHGHISCSLRPAAVETRTVFRRPVPLAERWSFFMPGLRGQLSAPTPIWFVAGPAPGWRQAAHPGLWHPLREPPDESARQETRTTTQSRQAPGAHEVRRAGTRICAWRKASIPVAGAPLRSCRISPARESRQEWLQSAASLPPLAARE